jgi:hypothetical protein
MYNQDEMPNNTATFVTPNHMLLPSKRNRYLPSGIINTVKQESINQIQNQSISDLVSQNQITGNLISL